MSTMKETNSYSPGPVTVPLSSLLLVLFIGLKLTDSVTWSWLWVLAPLWVPFAAALVLAAVMFIVVALQEILK